MRPVPTSFLLTLLIALCALCAWQWHRETALRKISSEHLEELIHLRSARDELQSRVKDADADILRLSGSFNELRNNSVAKPQHEEVLAANTIIREAIEKQNALIKEQNESLTKASATIQQSNESIKKLTAERDTLAKRVNEVTALYNKLANPAKP